MTKKQLNEYCEAEFENISAVVCELFLIVKDEKSNYSTAELAAIATFIHNSYNGIENVLKRVAYYRKEILKDTPTWHKDLLKTSFDSGILTEELYASLANYLSFRHFFVHAYSFTLTWEDVKPLAEELRETLETFTEAINSFTEQLGQ